MLAQRTLTLDPNLHRLLASINCIEDHALALLEQVDPNTQPSQGEDLEAIGEGARQLASLVAALDLEQWETIAQSAHNLRSPLSGIIGFSQTMLLYPDLYLEGGSRPTPAQRMYLNTIFMLGTEIYRSINNLVDYAKIQLDTLDIVCQPYDFTSVLSKLCQTAHDSCAERGLTFTVETAETLPTVLGDQMRTLQALTNLVSNAVRFTETGGVTIKAFPSGDVLGIHIADTGVGISAAMRRNLFTPFATSDSSACGLGLGLTIAQQLIDLQGGSLSVLANPAGGTIVSIYLCLA